MNNPEFIDVYDCSECPCMSRCYDENNCNLGYSLKGAFKEDGNIINCAVDCKLNSVSFENEIFEKELVKATIVHPNHWDK
jgi:hypothetical protein